MKISEAIALIRNPILEQLRIQSWCELGCRTGTFTMALCESLASGSTIHAVDMDANDLRLPLQRQYRVHHSCQV